MQSPENTDRLLSAGPGSALVGICHGIHSSIQRHRSLGISPVSSPALLDSYGETTDTEEMEARGLISHGLPGATPSFTSLKPPAVTRLHFAASAPPLREFSSSLDGDERLSIWEGESMRPMLTWLLSLTSSSKAMLDQINSVVQMTRMQLEITKEAYRILSSKKRLLSLGLASVSSQPSPSRQWSFSLRQDAALDDDATGASSSSICRDKALDFQHLKASTSTSAVKSPSSHSAFDPRDHEPEDQQASDTRGSQSSSGSSYQPGAPSVSQLLEAARTRWGGSAAAGAALPSVAEGEDEGRGSVPDRQLQNGNNQDRHTPGNASVALKPHSMRGGSLKRMMKMARNDV